MTVAELHKELGRIIRDGHADLPVTMDLANFPRECDGEVGTVSCVVVEGDMVEDRASLVISEWAL